MKDYSEWNMESLRKHAQSVGVDYRNEEGERLRKVELIEALEAHDEASFEAQLHDATREAAEDALVTPEPEPIKPVPVPMPSEPEKAPETKTLFRVVRAARYARGGMVHNLRSGTVINPQHYDIEDLKKQGVLLEADPEAQQGPSLDGYGKARRQFGRAISSNRADHTTNDPDTVDTVIKHPNGTREIVAPVSEDKLRVLQIRRDGARGVLRRRRDGTLMDSSTPPKIEGVANDG